MISYLNANEGKIELKDIGTGEVFCASADANVLAEAIKSLGVAETVLNSSSMDFASEYGFETNSAAWDTLYKALELAGWTFAEE